MGYYKGELTVSYDVRTEKSVKKFSKKYQLIQNGIADYKTLYTLDLAYMIEFGRKSGEEYSAMWNDEQVVEYVINNTKQLPYGDLSYIQYRDNKRFATVEEID